MPLDHYVSQVHLKNFYSPKLGERMYAIRKLDLFEFQCRAKDICRIEDNSTNSYLVHDRAIEDFLKDIEPKYNQAVAALKNGTIDDDVINVIAGFVAYVATCSPAGMRIQSEPIRRSVEATTTTLDAQGKLQTAPPSLGGARLSELIESGQVNVNIDPKYPQALGIDGIRQFIIRLGNAMWQILVNTTSDSPFFTSDFPIAIEATPDPAVVHRIIPLGPEIALRIIPDVRSRQIKVGEGFPLFSAQRRTLSHQQVCAVNTAIVRCAEKLVFFRNRHDWVPSFVRKNAAYRIDSITTRHGLGKNQLLIATQKIVTHYA